MNDAEFARDRNFIAQQGLVPPAGPACHPLARALQFQPRVIGPLVLVASLFQSTTGFLLLAAVLWWSAAFPRFNPFDALYHRLHPSAPALPLAPGPRRFAMVLAGATAALTVFALERGVRPLAYGLEAFFLIAVLAIAFGGLCFGSFIFHTIRGRLAFALATLPWGRGS